MDLHSDVLTHAHLYDAKREARVDFTALDEKGSRTRLRRFKFKLEGYTSNRRPNWGTGARDTHDGMAATWDEWGIFLNVLFQRDPMAHTGTHGYLGLEGFRHQTNGRYDTLTHADQHVDHNWKWNGRRGDEHMRVCACGAEYTYTSPEGLVVVKHGLIRPTELTSVEAWLAQPQPVPA